MSADNWTQCPRCARDRVVAAQRLNDQANAAYATVTVAEFDKLRAMADEAMRAPDTMTFREDYEVGLHEGDLFIDYRGGCKACNLAVKFRHEARVDLDLS